MGSDSRSDRKSLENVRSFLTLDGFRYWTASRPPALVDTNLPFCLRPPGFSFRLFAALEFLIAAVVIHAVFSFLLTDFEGYPRSEWQKPWLFSQLSTGYFF